MKFISNDKYVFYLGCRVIVNLKERWYYGTVYAFEGENSAEILFDYKDNRKVVDVSKMQLTSNWSYQPKPVDDIKLVPLTQLPPEKSVNKVVVPVSISICFAMWLYINNKVFDGVLQTPTIRLNNSTKLLGACYSTYWSGKPTLLEFSKTNLSSKNLFDTIAHEMVHQFNFEVDGKSEKLRAVLSNPKNSHGTLFMRLAPNLAEIGVKLTPTADVTRNADVDINTNKQSGSYYYLYIEIPVEGNRGEVSMFAVAVRLDSQATAEKTYVSMSSKTNRVGFVNYIKDWVFFKASSGALQEYTSFKNPDVLFNDIDFFIKESSNPLFKKIVKVTDKDLFHNHAALDPRNTYLTPLTLDQRLALGKDNTLASMSVKAIQKEWE